MALQKSVVVEGQSINRVTLFDGSNYVYWSIRMSIYIKVLACEICTTASEIWDKLKVIHEGASQVKESKTALFTYNYEMFKMELDEDVTTVCDKFTNITNKLN
ncbi:hypothetical protein QQP08_001798 [Theobroma cacao]|nr:hypothetical protein QQP08_001798 [Theobroma cacao]